MNAIIDKAAQKEPGRTVPADASEAMLDVVQAMIQMVYQVALDPNKFDDLVAAWDAFEARANSTGSFLIVEEHFEQALTIAANPKFDKHQDVAAVLDLVAGPAILVDQEGQLIAANRQGEALVPVSGETVVAGFRGEWRPKVDAKTQHINYQTPAGEALLASCRRVALQGSEESNYLIRFAIAGWSHELSATLARTYDLTEAEIAVAELLFDGQSTAEIAKARGRSPETIRTQIKSVMNKTGTRKRVGFVQLMAHLQYIVTDTAVQAAVTKPFVAANGADFRQRAIDAGCARTLMVSEYGVQGGRDVVYFTASTVPAETEHWRSCVTQAGLRLIAPHRPGFGGSTAVGDWDKTAEFLAEMCRDRLQLSPQHPPIFVGHREGGILACDVAQRLSDVLAIEDVFLIGTGVPGKNQKSRNMSRNARALSTIPSALRLGYRTARRVFLSGDRGAEQIAKFFFKDSPYDQELIKEPGPKAALMGNLAYCFENTDLIVDDVAKWTSNWASSLRKQMPGVRWHFLHGEHHEFMELADTAAFCEAHEDTSLTVLEGTAQYGLYADPAPIVARIAAAT